MSRLTFALGLFLATVALAACSTAAANPHPAGTPGPNDITIAADGMQFVERQVTARAGVRFAIRFDNREAAPHNVSLSDAAGANLVRGEIFGGPAVGILEVGPLAAGSYAFTCDLHPGMDGTLTVS